MRLLSDLEKDICNRILQNSGSNNFIANIIDRDLDNVCIVVNRTPKAASLEFTIRNQLPTPEEQNYVIEKAEELSIFILQLVNLLQILVKDGYIMMLERGSNSQQPNRFGRCVTNLPNIIYDFKDQSVINLLCEYTNKEIYVTEEFSRFCKKGHIARDEQRFKRQISITQIALGVAILALLLNVGINLVKKTPDSITINKIQIESIKESIDKIHSKLIESEQKNVRRELNHNDPSKKEKNTTNMNN